MVFNLEISLQTCSCKSSLKLEFFINYKIIEKNAWNCFSITIVFMPTSGAADFNVYYLAKNPSLHPLRQCEQIICALS